MKEKIKEETKVIPLFQLPEHDFILDDDRFKTFLKMFGVGYRCYHCGSYEIAVIETEKSPILTNQCSCGKTSVYYFNLVQRKN